MRQYKDYINLGIFVFLIVLTFLIIKPFVLAALVGILLAYMFYSMHKWLKKKVKNDTTSALLICVLVVIVLFVVSGLFINSLVRESYVIYAVSKQKLATGIFTNCDNSFCNAIKDFGQDPSVKYQIEQGVKTVTNFLIEKGSSFLLKIPNIILNLFVVFFIMFYGLRDGPMFLSKLNKFLSMGKKRYQFILHRLKEIISGVVYGYLLVALIQGAIGALGFFIFGVTSPIFWGLVMALLALIPFLGTGFIWVPASLILFLNGIFQDSTSMILKGIGLFAYSLIFVSSIDNIIRPKMIGEKARVHPVVILMGILGGIFVFGPLGVIFGPLILSLTIVFINIYVMKEKT